MSKWQKIVMIASTKELEDWSENRSEDIEPKCSHYPVNHGEIDEYETEEQQLAVLVVHKHM